MAGNLYTSNFLVNSSCENQNVIDWEYLNVVAKPGGVDSSYLFELGPTAFMEQTVLASTIGDTPPNLRICASYKLPQRQDPIDTSIKAYITLTVEYKDDTFDVFNIPCTDNVQYKDNLLNDWLIIKQECVLQDDKLLEVVKIKITTENIIGGLQLDYITLQADTALDKSTSDTINAQLPNLIYYTNPTIINISTVEAQPVYLGVTTTANSNISVSLAIYGVASSTCTLTISIQIDTNNIPFSPIKQIVQTGDFIIGIPLYIPQIAAGAHYIGIKVVTDSNSIVINPSMLQLAIDGRYIAGGLTSELPHAEIKQYIYYRALDTIFNIEDFLNVIVDLPMLHRGIQYVSFVDVGRNGIDIYSNTDATITLTQAATISEFTSEEATEWNTDSDYVLMDNNLRQKTEFIDTVIPSVLGTGYLYSFILLESTDLSSIAKLEVE